MRNPAPKDLNKEGISSPTNYNPKEGYQVHFGEPQEILDSPEDNEQYFPQEGLSPFISLKEDELLMAIEAQTAKRNHVSPRKGYRMVRQQSRRQEENKQMQDPQLLHESLPLQVGKQADAGEMMAYFNQVDSKLRVQYVHQIFHFMCLMKCFGVLY
ncbi:UNVERIFIED_CONTAM: hypothetical protein K2H54_041089 [Gekko kuhli]